MLIVVGLKDLPNALRTFSRAVGRLRRAASEIHGQVDNLRRETKPAADARQAQRLTTPLHAPPASGLLLPASVKEAL